MKSENTNEEKKNKQTNLKQFTKFLKLPSHAILPRRGGSRDKPAVTNDRPKYSRICAVMLSGPECTYNFDERNLNIGFLLRIDME